ncbi:MAG: hypothetical protein QOD09_724 [Bradyrhizobium sp.]|jgi:hypothetical protein|nr:hypothetical protein [Bradyrhizobium sp.]
MHLLLGHPEDLCCVGVFNRLEARGLPVRIVAAPLAPPARLRWRLDAAGLASSLYPDTPDTGIAGILVRDTGWLEPDGWDEADHVYMQAELRAVTLAWLAGLACPVINRPDAALWYRAGAPVLAWRALLRRSGLPLPEVVVTSDPAEARAFRRRLAMGGVAGAVYAPLTEAASYLLADDDAWERLAALQLRAPVCLAEPHGPPTLGCIVGNAVIWDRAPPPEAVALEPALSRFAAAAHLAFVEIALAPVRRGLAVVLVDTLPRLEHFALAARDRIIDALVALLVPEGAVTSATRGTPP